MALDTANATVILRTLTKKFDNRLQAATPFYPRITTPISSMSYDESYGMLGSIPAVREWLGERKAKELRASTYTLVNRDWESTTRIPKNSLADDRYGMYSSVLEELALRAAHHPDKLLFETLVLGESVATWDGQFFFDTDHLWGESGSQSNDLTMAAATGTVPTVAEFKAAFDQATAALVGFKDDQGEPLNIPTFGPMGSLLCIIPAALWQTAAEALTAQLIGGGNTNVVLNSPQIIPSPYLTDATKFYVVNTGSVLKPFIFQDRQALERGTKGLDDLETKDVLFMTQSRYAIGTLAWWTAVLTTFT